MNIQITKNAWKKISEILHKTNNHYGMIYSASSGGCNGFNFELDLLTNPIHQKINKNKFLTILTNEKSKVYIDPLSEMYLLGTTIDYINEDFNVDILDIVILVNVVLGIEEILPQQEQVADCNQDGNIDVFLEAALFKKN